MNCFFQNALPVWPRGRREKMNDFVLFTCDFSACAGDQTFLRITGCTYYRVKVNGVFLAHGPMRAPKGFFRVSELPFVPVNGKNTLEIEIAGSNVNSFDYMDQPSFLQAEVVAKKNVVAFSGKDFHAFDLGKERIQKVSRLSYQRMFFEAYRVAPVRKDLPELELETAPGVRYLASVMPEPEYRIDDSYHPVATLRRTYLADGALRRDNAVDNEFGANGTQSLPNRALTLVGFQGFKGFRQEELDVNAFLELGRYVRDDQGKIASTLFEGKINNAGFLKLHVVCTKPGRLVAMFDEIGHRPAGVDPLRLDVTCACFWDLLGPGEYFLESLEPYAFKYVETFMHEGEISLCEVSLREYKSPLPLKTPPPTLSGDLKKIYRAGCESFAANAVDVFTDCPTRERGGYIGDSFFTARAALSLTGSTVPEAFFLENYLLAPRHEGLPDGAFPMEYPGDHPTGQFIPNWGMWLLLQLEEYLARSGDRKMIGAFRKKILAFVDYIDRFCNEDGLPENLPGWVFVEWSRANTLTAGVNYPSAMLYARSLESVGALYDIPEYKKRADVMKKTIAAQSFDGQYFRDHALRANDGKLTVAPDRTEICQYYAFFFGVATPETYPLLWENLLAKFAPQCPAGKDDVAPANMIMGHYLRLALLVEAGLKKQALDEISASFIGMAEKTGTLWEHDDARASCCHGIASFISHLILQAAHVSALR
ncbi:MAG: hypothetical protein MJ016_01615 [Victivallaceae bacterium]|nr:hypothetical protein [Victivallaceae bacterium]